MPHHPPRLAHRAGRSDPVGAQTPTTSSADAQWWRLHLRQMVSAVAGVLVALGLFAACVVLFILAAAPWGPCDPSQAGCGPSRGPFVGAAFVCAVLGLLVLAGMAVWLRRLQRRRRRLLRDR